MDWKEILAYIIFLILTGHPPRSAVAKAAERFGVDESEVWEHWNNR